MKTASLLAGAFLALASTAALAQPDSGPVLRRPP